jgi:hypothetical protein
MFAMPLERRPVRISELMKTDRLSGAGKGRTDLPAIVVADTERLRISLDQAAATYVRERAT